MKIACLCSDYDGTISSLDVSRHESKVPPQISLALSRIGKMIPVSILTMKDLSFIVPRTPFADAWSALGGLETRIGGIVSRKRCCEESVLRVHRALDYAKSRVLDDEVEIEEKKYSDGRTAAFCLDWRRARDKLKARQRVSDIERYCRSLRLFVLDYEGQSYCDVHPVAPDKGTALQELLDGSSIAGDCMYLGDSDVDNPAFKISSVSIGVVHDETIVSSLDCEYLVDFERVSDLLNVLLSKSLVFSSNFSMIRTKNHRAEKTVDR